MNDLWIPHVVRKDLKIDPARDPHIHPVGAIFHIAVSEKPSLFAEFAGRTDGIESHGYIRREGHTEQYRPLNVECDANGDGNSWVNAGTRYGFTSWESQGGVPDGRGEWTDFQLAEIKRIIRHHHDHFGVPLRLAPAWNAPGFGYHRLYDRWNHNKHSCPGDQRVEQFHNLIVPWLRTGAAPPHKSRVQLARELLVEAEHHPTASPARRAKIAKGLAALPLK